MNEAQNPLSDSEPLRRIDAICDRFEAAWNAGRRLRIEDCLQEQPEPQRAHCFHSLLIIEIHLRRRDGEDPQPAEYSARFPDFTDLVDLAFREAEVTDRPEPPRQRFPIRLNCPHCHNPIAIIEGDAQDEVICPSCGSSFRLDPDRTVTWDPQKLPKLGKFELLEPVGKGAFGTVYRAHDTQLDRTVAVKVPRSGTFATQQDEDRFVREGRSAAQLHHPGIVTVYEVGRGEAFPYIVSEFVEGVTLAEMLDSRTGRKFTFRESVELVALIADALQHAHDKGVVHRDLKPSNILLQKVTGGAASGQARDSATNSPNTSHQTPLTLQYAPRLMDFGLARRDEREITMTIEGQVLGTPAYMSTEQARGFGHQADGRTDIYSVGVTLYKLLTDELPFQGTAHMVRHQHIHDEPRPPRQLNHRIPRDLETICLKCMEKEPSRRYSSAQDLAAELRRWLDGQPIQARPISRLERSWRWCKRKPVVATLTAAIAFVLVVGILVSSYFAVRAGKEADRATAEATNAINEKKRADLKSVEAAANAIRADEKAADAIASAKEADRQTQVAQRNLYAARMNLAQRNWEIPQVELVLDLLDKTRPQPGETDLHGFEWHYWDRLCHSHLLELKGHTREVWSVAFSPDGNRLASASGDQTVKVWDATSGAESLTLKGHTSLVRSVAFSADGKRLASASDDETVKVWDATSGAELLTLKGHTHGVTSVAFSPDGNRLASASWDKTVKVWDATSGAESLTLKGHTVGVTSVAFGPDGKRLASASGEFQKPGEVKVWDATSGAESLTLKGHTGNVWSVAFSPDGKRLASASDDQTVKVWDATSGAVSLTLKGHTDWVRSVAFSPDGKRLASASWDQTVKVWDATSGAESLTLKGHTKPVASVAFSPDGRRLASASGEFKKPGEVKVWDATSGAESLTLNGHTGWVSSVAFSPDGKRLASASGYPENTVKVWDATSGAESLTLKGHTSYVWSVAFSPDGKRLASASWDRTVRVWDATTGQETLTLKGHSNGVPSVAFSPDGKRLASASYDGTVKVWDATSGAESLTLKGHTGVVWSVAFSPDGKRLASASNDQTVKVWDATSGAESLTLKGHTYGVNSVAFSPDGKRLASASEDLTVKVWDATSGQETLTLKGHTGSVKSVAFSPDGKRLASASRDKTVKLWDATSGQETLTLKGHTYGVNSVAFSPDGNRLASASADEVMLWDARPWTPELRADQEARSLLTSLASQLSSRESLVRAIEQDTTVSEPARRRALEWATAFWNGFVSPPAERLVREQLAQGKFKQEVVDAISADASLSDGVRSRALELARNAQEDPNALNKASWDVVRQPNRTATEYTRALLQAEAACRIQPDYDPFLNTLGVAQYRNGKFDDALQTLTRSNELNSRDPVGVQPADVAFLAMTHHHLGRTEESQKLLARLRQLLQADRWKTDPDSQLFLREAESLIEPPPAQPPPPPLPDARRANCPATPLAGVVPALLHYRA